MISTRFKNVYINCYDAIVGLNEKNGNIKGKFKVIDDLYYHSKTFEQALITMQKDVLCHLLNINNLTIKDVNLIIGGDLSNQLTCTSYSLSNMSASFLGVYSACASFIESLIIGSVFIEKRIINNAVLMTSSHNLVAERQFRYPVEYGSLKNENSTFTATASIASFISREKGNIKVVASTIGEVKTLDVKDPNYIGAIMAPSCGDTIYQHLKNLKIDIDYYDVILTGDLGSVGVSILKEYLFEEYNIKANNVIDAGANLYKEIADINDGASGPCCLPLYFFYNILNKKRYKKILLVGTGALHSKTMVNQNIGIPSVSHAVSLEVIS